MATSVNVKMYKVGELGDCFLLTFRHDETIKHMLIDCGSFRNGKSSSDRMLAIAEDIAKQVKGDTKGNLDIVVGTHQHNDHVSGFVHAEELFKETGIEQVWLSWLDNPRSRVANRIEQSHLDLRKALSVGAKQMNGLPRHGLSGERIVKTQMLVEDLLGFFGAAPELPSQGIKILKKIGVNAVDYLTPGELKAIPGIPLDEIKVHVLGPPRDTELLYRKDPREGESYDHKLRAASTMARQFLKGLENRIDDDKTEEHFPFNGRYKKSNKGRENFGPALKDITELYSSDDNSWRNIDSDWLEQGSRLALYMDTFTNNSSLVLAIELVKSEKVLLFAGDAQTGNWLSWENVKFKDQNTSLTGLLERTVLYKVGHHGSHNSTLKPLFEKMRHEDLVAMIPVDKSDSNIKKKNGWKMPAAKLFQRLKERTHYRVLRMDENFAKGCDPEKDPVARDAWARVGKPSFTKMYVEFTVL